MKKQLRNLIVAAAATLALGALPACSSGTGTDAAESTTPDAPADFPESARYIADMPMSDGGIMSIGVAVDGEQVVAYACDGKSDEAWFFGDQTDGNLDITGKFGDTLTASYADGDVKGDLTMDGVTYPFNAVLVTDPAGMYTALDEVSGVRSSWIVHADGTITGVKFSGFKADDDVNPFQAQQQLGQRVREKRILQQAAQFNIETKESTIDGKPVKAELVTGRTTFG